jgi:predicted MFS family arabinose efflux permease
MKNFSRQELVLLFTLAAIQFTHILDFMIMMPLAPIFKEVFKIDSHQHSILVASYNISAGISAFLAAFFIDKFDRKKALLFVYSGFILGTLACALSINYHFFLMARVLTGFFGGIASAVIASIIGDAIPNERRATAMGILMSAFSIASVIGVPLGLYIANSIDWHAPFFLVVGLSAALWVLASFNIPSMAGHIVHSGKKPNPLHVLTNISSDPNQLRALGLMVCLMLGHFSIIPFISDYLVNNVGVTKNQLPLMYLVGGVVTIFSSPLVGRMADKYSRFKVLAVFSCIAIIPILAISNMPPLPLVYVLMITALFFICSGGRMIPANAMVTATVLPQHRGGFMSINSSLIQLSSGLASYIAGSIVLNDAKGALINYNYVGYMAAGFSLLVIFIAAGVKEVDIKDHHFLKTD